MSVHVAVTAELTRLGEAAQASVEGQTALALAAALDDGVGVQAGGLASTAKQLCAVMETIRSQHKPQGVSRLELLRGGGAG